MEKWFSQEKYNAIVCFLTPEDVGGQSHGHSPLTFNTYHMGLDCKEEMKYACIDPANSCNYHAEIVLIWTIVPQGATKKIGKKCARLMPVTVKGPSDFWKMA